MPRLSLEIVARTDAGRVRALNEDRVSFDEELGLAILADGMGGQAAGSRAAEMAVDVVATEVNRVLRALKTTPAKNENFTVSVALREGANKANRAIRDAAQAEERCRDMGTTLTAAVFAENSVTVAHVGDSRLYRLREGKLTLLTRDHSLLQEQLEVAAMSREAARYSHNRHLVSRALGMDPEVKLDLKTEALMAGDLYLLCSDGLNDMVDDDDIELVLSLLKCNLALAASQLIMIARDQGGHDNISVVLAHARPKAKSWLARLTRGLR
ncbi:MAG: PP2C family protein-serine/threonine phosphatase [Burkholderiales bacterium]